MQKSFSVGLTVSILIQENNSTVKFRDVPHCLIDLYFQSEEDHFLAVRFPEVYFIIYLTRDPG